MTCRRLHHNTSSCRWFQSNARPTLYLGSTRSYASKETLSEEKLFERRKGQQLLSERRDPSESRHIMGGMGNSMKLPLLDLTVPTKWKDHPAKTSPGAIWRWASRAILDNVASIFALIDLARAGLLPIENQPKGIRSILFNSRTFNVSSTKPDSWMGPFAKTAFTTYHALNVAMASGDRQALRNLCRDEYLETAMRRIHSRPKNVSLIWKFHEEVTPTACVALRQTKIPSLTGIGEDMHLAHALVRFDTMQSLDVRNSGKMARARPAAPVEPKRVTEYLVFEGRLEGPNVPWVVRDQLWPDPVQYLVKPKGKE